MHGRESRHVEPRIGDKVLGNTMQMATGKLESRGISRLLEAALSGNGGVAHGRAQRQPQRDVPNRGMTAEEAAQLYGLSSSSFFKARREGKIPAPTLPGGRYDRVLLERTMDRLSGVDRNPILTPLDEWRSRRGSGQS